MLVNAEVYAVKNLGHEMDFNGGQNQSSRSGSDVSTDETVLTLTLSDLEDSSQEYRDRYSPELPVIWENTVSTTYTTARSPPGNLPRNSTQISNLPSFANSTNFTNSLQENVDQIFREEMGSTIGQCDSESFTDGEFPHIVSASYVAATTAPPNSRNIETTPTAQNVTETKTCQKWCDRKLWIFSFLSIIFLLIPLIVLLTRLRDFTETSERFEKYQTKEFHLLNYRFHELQYKVKGIQQWLEEYSGFQDSN